MPPSVIESRSIDFIPDAERHGGLASQFTLWLSANMQITAVVTGALAVVLGGDVFWSLLGLLAGQLIGGAVMALHGAQGPKLGLPQMISSRVQFGVYGAAIPIVAVCLMYIGFSASGSILAGQALSQLLGIDLRWGIVTFAALIIGVTMLGYRVIHWLGRVSTAVGAAVFAYMFYRLLAQHDVEALLRIRHFSLNHFLLSMSLSASWQIAFGPYVADYSRYLPRVTRTGSVFAAVGLGSIIGAQIAMTFGVFAAALAGTEFEHHEVAYIVGLGSSGAAATLLFFCIAFGKLMVTSLNSYGSFMSMATLVGGFRGVVRLSRLSRLGYIVAAVGVACALALAGKDSFLTNFEAFILLLLAVFTPWSAINLVDYYCFTRSNYDVPALSDPNGRYGRWNMRGIVIYLIGILVQIPFLATGLYTGPCVASLGGADVSWILGLIVPGLIYYAVGRRADRQPPARESSAAQGHLSGRTERFREP